MSELSEGWGIVAGDTERAILPQSENMLLDPDMPTQELLLHMGELTESEMLVARAAIRWANSQILQSSEGGKKELLFILKNISAIEGYLWSVKAENTTEVMEIYVQPILNIIMEKLKEEKDGTTGTD